MPGKPENITLSGKGKLTGKVIDKLTVYYGLAIRRNCTGTDAVQKMKNAIWATFFHYSSTDKKPQHDVRAARNLGAITRKRWLLLG